MEEKSGREATWEKGKVLKIWQPFLFIVKTYGKVLKRKPSFW
jgi:hypothetical protein